MIEEVIEAVVRLAGEDRRGHPIDPLDTNTLAQVGLDLDVTADEDRHYLLDEVLLELARIKRVVKAISTVVAEEMTKNVADLGAVRIGDTVYRASRKKSTRLVDREGLVRWLAAVDTIEDAVQAITAVVRVDTGNVRVTNLRAIAKDRDTDPVSIFDSFFEVTEADDADPVLDAIPANVAKAPKWVSALAEGERDTSRRLQ